MHGYEIDCQIGELDVCLLDIFTMEDLPYIELECALAGAGDDGMMLAVGEALEELFGRGEPPPRQPACQGCSHTVNVQEPPAGNPPEVNSRKEAHRAAEEYSIYSFSMTGICEHLRRSRGKDEL